MTDAAAPVGIVGAGTMGAGIAQLALEAGRTVFLHDADREAIDRGRVRIREGLERRARRLDLDAESADAWIDGRFDRLRGATTLAEIVAGGPELVVEAALEDVGVKREIFATLDALDAAPILATNTSALSIGSIAAATRRPERVLGLHFFNPAPVMPLVEVVVAAATDPTLVERATAIVTAWGKVAVPCADTPGFIVNRVNRPFTLEALAILADGGADIVTIDTAIRAAGFPLGPFELMDLIGIDVNLAVARGLFDASVAAGDRLAVRFEPSPIQERLVAAGRLGRKTNAGFYRYDDGRRGDPIDALASAGVAGSQTENAPSPAASVTDADVVARITLAIVNEAYRALGDGVATAADIDLALHLGASHPIGPFERATELGGPSAVVAALRPFEGLGPRFDPAPPLVSAT